MSDLTKGAGVSRRLSERLTNVSFGVLLTATDQTTAQRLAQREIEPAVHEHIERSKLAAARLDAPSTAYKVPTDCRSLADIAANILDSAGPIMPSDDRSIGRLLL